MIGIATGAVVFFIALACGAMATFAGLIAWNAAVVVYLAMLWRLFLGASEAEVRHRAARQDERRGVILLLIIIAVLVSLGAITGELLQVRRLPRAEQMPVAAVAALTLIASWALLQSIFALHYAHEHFRDVDRRGEGGGVAFPGEGPRTYLDFVYLAVCVGATCQVSDTNITSSRIRRLVTAHGVTAFFFNTAVVALGINILAGLLAA